MNEPPAVPAPRKFVFAPWMAAVLTAMILASGLFGARPLFRLLKEARARHFARQSEDLTAAEKWPEAFAKAQAAYQLQPEDPETIRAMALILEKRNPPASVPFLRLLAATDAATFQDLSQYAEACLQLGNLDEALGQINRLLRREPGNANAIRMAARVYGAKGDLDQALRLARQAEEKEPQNTAGQALIVQIQIASPDPAVQKTGWEGMWKLARDPGPQGLDSLRRLAHWNGLTADRAGELTRMLREHPRGKEADKLLASQVELQFHPGHREDILARAVGDAKNADGNTLHTLGIWLNGLGEYQKTLAMLPEKKAISRQDLFLVHLDALAALNRWKEIGRLLAIKDAPLADVYLRLFAARAAEMEGRKDEADIDWRRAHTAATGNPSEMLYLAQYAEKAGREAQAIQAYESLAADVPTARLAYENLLRLAQARFDAAGTLQILAEMLKRWPSEPAVRNDYAYMSALLGKDLAESRSIAEGLVLALPNELPHRTALALAFLRLKDPSSALAVYQGLNIPWDAAPGRDKAVYTAVLGANEKKEEANKMAASIMMNTLFPEERTLAQPWLKRP